MSKALTAATPLILPPFAHGRSLWMRPNARSEKSAQRVVIKCYFWDNHKTSRFRQLSSINTNCQVEWTLACMLVLNVVALAPDTRLMVTKSGLVQSELNCVLTLAIIHWIFLEPVQEIVLVDVNFAPVSCQIWHLCISETCPESRNMKHKLEY